jgi:hypothetical protein
VSFFIEGSPEDKGMVHVELPKGLLFLQYSFKGIMCTDFCTSVKRNVELLKKI